MWSTQHFPATQTWLTHSRPATLTRCDTGSKHGRASSAPRSTAQRSADLPGVIEPISRPRPSALAAFSVAMRRISLAGSALASPVSPFASSDAKRISPKRSSRLLLAAPSVPSPTLMPSCRICATGANPLASFRLDVGQWAIWLPVSEMSSRSWSLIWTA